MWTQAKLLAYDQTRQHEELETQQALAGGGKAGKSSPSLGRGKRGRRR